MTAARYAQGTSVDSSASRAEIERTLTRYGARSFMYGWEESRAALAFSADGRQVRFILPLPDRHDRRFTHTPAKGQKRTPEAAEKEYEQACRQSWRALALVVKAKLEAVAAGIVSFEQEFLAHIVLPNGRTVFEETSEAVETAYRTGSVKPLLQIEG
jgi:DNA-binding IclR family transcriptional regulator